MAIAWTEAEKAQLLSSIIDTHIKGTIDWDAVNIPEGRTVKACRHILTQTRKLAQEAPGATTPKSEKTVATPRRRRKSAPKQDKKAPATKQEASEDEDEDNEESAVESEGSPTKRLKLDRRCKPPARKNPAGQTSVACSNADDESEQSDSAV